MAQAAIHQSSSETFRIRAGLLLAFAIALGVWAGWRLAELTPSTLTLWGISLPLGKALGTLSTGAVFAVAKQIWDTLAKFMTLADVRSIFDWKVVGDAGKVCLAILGVVFGVLTFRASLDSPPTPSDNPGLAAIVFTERPAEPWDGSEPLAVFPLMYEQNAQRTADPQGVNGWGTGVAVKTRTPVSDKSVTVADFDTPLKALVRALKGCAKPADAQTAAQPVKLKVRGFASSSEFKQPNNVIDQRSDALNLDVANARAKAVAAALKDVVQSLGADSSFEIRAESWPTDGGYALMISDRPYIDRFTGWTEAPEMLTRRAEVLLVHAAQCQRLGRRAGESSSLAAN